MMKRVLAIFAKLPPYCNTAIVAALILYLTLAPHPLPDDTPTLFDGADKVVHGIMFWALATAMSYDYYRRTNRLSTRQLIIFAITSGIAGGAIELLQEAMNMGRGGDPLDFLADCIGAATAAVMSRPLVRWLLD